MIEDLRERELLVEAGRITHRYPICWRCKTPLVFRVVDDWFISCRGVRQPLLDANATVEWTPVLLLEADGRLAAQHGRLEHLAQAVLRPTAALLPVRVRPPERRRLARPSSRQRATGGLDQLQELHRPWIDEVPITCDGVREGGSRESPRSATPGSTPASSRSRRSAGRTRSGSSAGTRPGASQGLSGADLPDHAYWEQWFPADWISESREQIRLWFYSMSFMSVTLDRAARPYERVLAYERVRDETRARDAQVDRQHDRGERGDRAMGADVMRWMYCEQVPSQNLNFGYGPAHEIKRRLLTLWNSVKFFVDYANVSPAGGAGELEPLDRWLLARVEQLVAEADRRVRAVLDAGRDRVVRELRGRPLELVHPPLPATVLERGRRGAARRSGLRLRARSW